MDQEKDEILKAQQIIATSVEIAKSLPEYEADTDVDQFNIHLGQFVEMTKIDLKVLKNMLLLRLKGQALTFLKQIENSIGTEATSTINSIELLQQAFQKRFIDTSSLNKLKHGLVTFEQTQNVREYLHKVRIATEARYGPGEGELYEKIILNAFKQGLNPKLYRLLIAKNIDNLELAVQEIERAVEIDSIVLQHQKMSINAVESKAPVRSRDSSPRFFSRESSPKPVRNQIRTTTPPRQVRFAPNNQLRAQTNNEPLRCYTCNRLGHIARNCFANNNNRPNIRGTGNRLSRGTNYSGYAPRGDRGNTFVTGGNYPTQSRNFQRNTYQYQGGYRGRTNQPSNSWNRNTRENYISRRQPYNSSISSNNQGTQNRTNENSTSNIWESQGNDISPQNS
ncbi:GATA zinc finger domain-containing protein 4-like [Artemia franciscana]|uniref:GATA zinc finger domain-containing protein 4-like n=1 Tax=Artemia franciscana TaxID=6661 RepID=UPI0032DA0BD3